MTEAVIIDPDDEPMYLAIEAIVKAILEHHPGECDSHGRTYISEHEGRQYCYTCAGDGFSGDLSVPAVDSTTYEIIEAINKAHAKRLSDATTHTGQVHDRLAHGEWP